MKVANFAIIFFLAAVSLGDSIGNAMRIIHAIDRPFQHDGRDYYWDARYAKDELREGRTIQCKMPVDDDDKLFKHFAPASANKSAVSNGTFVEQALLATFSNETRPKEIVWTCKWAEYCCGTECCPLSGISTTSSVIILSIGWCLLIVGFCVWGIWGCCTLFRRRKSSADQKE
uniref:CX domain-containing protein n=1 Tax=Globodera pallida TaxID=36090 RepID=A0A183BJ22_GLOPA